MKLVNLTPHPVTLLFPTGSMTIQPEAVPARVSMRPDTHLADIHLTGFGPPAEPFVIPLMGTAMGGTITGLPDPAPDVLYLVSRQVIDTAPDRTDLVMPHQVVREQGTPARLRPGSARAWLRERFTGRPEAGRIIGCRALGRPTAAKTSAAELIDWTKGDRVDEQPLAPLTLDRIHTAVGKVTQRKRDDFTVKLLDRVHCGEASPENQFAQQSSRLPAGHPEMLTQLTEAVVLALREMLTQLTGAEYHSLLVTSEEFRAWSSWCTEGAELTRALDGAEAQWWLRTGKQRHEAMLARCAQIIADRDPAAHTPEVAR